MVPVAEVTVGLGELDADATLESNPSFVTAIREQLGRFFPEGWEPSTGFRTAVLALTVCDELELFGFEDEPEGTPYHYWDAPGYVDDSADADAREKHMLETEHALIAALSRLDHLPYCEHDYSSSNEGFKFWAWLHWQFLLWVLLLVWCVFGAVAAYAWSKRPAPSPGK